VVLPSMTTRLADGQGFVTDEAIAYYRARAAGGVGLVTVEMACPETAGRHRQRELGIHDDRFLPGLARLVAAIKEDGASACIQLGHGGGHTRADIAGEPPIAPSAIPHSVFERTNETVVPLEMTLDRIAETTMAFAAAAARAQAAGFDCVEVHGAHGYLLSQFLCPAENRRRDAYGGALENRARFALDILRRTKAAVPDLPVIFRFNANDYMPDGIGLEDALEIGRWAEDAGADALHVTAGHYRSVPDPAIMIPPMAYPEATFLGYAGAIKARVSIPVIAVGRLGDPAVAKAAVDDGCCDFVALGRPLLADPDWVAKARAGMPVRRCIACNTCVNDMRGGARLGCLVNPAAGREAAFAEATLPKGERILVVGAGPAGLSYAALVAGRNGNAVTVIDRAGGPGGSLRDAALAPKFQDVEAAQGPITAFIEDLERACRDAGAAIRYGVDLRSDPALARGHDRIVLATGASYRFGLGLVARALLEHGFGKTRLARHLFRSERFRQWLYFNARQATGGTLRRHVPEATKITVIGDAAKAGKAKEAIASAYRAAHGGDAERGRD
jgi:2,4-dienoyl-CoA reductase-like NADH-dependent reductase (Old Yellow Enzyme family)